MYSIIDKIKDTLYVYFLMHKKKKQVKEAESVFLGRNDVFPYFILLSMYLSRKVMMPCIIATLKAEVFVVFITPYRADFYAYCMHVWWMVIFMPP